MVVVFRYTSNQKAIRVAKDHLKAHLLAVRLFQDQLQVVLISYWRILRSTGSYLRLAFMPLLYVSVPLILLMVQVVHLLMVFFQQMEEYILIQQKNGQISKYLRYKKI